MDLPVLEKKVLMLPEKERALLANLLLVSLETDSGALKQKWIEESESRLQAWQSGLISALDGPETMASLRLKFAK
ncbi:MAG: addiction module protein [Spartobacteria bacterium]